MIVPKVNGDLIVSDYYRLHGICDMDRKGLRNDLNKKYEIYFIIL